MRKLIIFLVTGILWCNVGIAEIKQKYHCAGQTIAGNLKWDLTLKKRTVGEFYDVWDSFYFKDDSPHYANYVKGKNSNMLMWFSTSADEGGTLYVNFLEFFKSEVNHAAMSIDEFKSTAEFDSLHKSYMRIQELKKSTKQTDRPLKMSAEANFYIKAGHIMQRSIKQNKFYEMFNIPCK